MPDTLSYFANEEEKESKLWKKLKEDVIFPLGIVVFIGMVGYGLYGIRSRQIPMSMYLMHLRVASQGLCIGILSLGMAYHLGKRLYAMYTKAEPTDTTSITKQPN